MDHIIIKKNVFNIITLISEEQNRIMGNNKLI